MQMLRTFSREAFEFGLASWRWLGISGKTPRFTTLFGDVFLESLEGWWFLDTVEGTLELRWTSAVDMYAELDTPEGRATYLLDDLVQEAERRGLRPAPDEVYSFHPHPAVGGDMAIESVTTVRFALAVSWAGQLHEQLRWSAPSAPEPVPAAQVVEAERLATAWDTAWQDTPAATPTGRHAQIHAPAADPYPADGRAHAATGATPAAAYADATDSWPTQAYDPYAAGYAAGYATGAFPAVAAAQAAPNADPGYQHQERYAPDYATTGSYPTAGYAAATGAVQAAGPAWDDLWQRR